MTHPINRNVTRDTLNTSASPRTPYHSASGHTVQYSTVRYCRTLLYCTDTPCTQTDLFDPNMPTCSPVHIIPFTYSRLYRRFVLRDRPTGFAPNICTHQLCSSCALYSTPPCNFLQPPTGVRHRMTRARASAPVYGAPLNCRVHSRVLLVSSYLSLLSEFFLS